MHSQTNDLKSLLWLQRCWKEREQLKCEEWKKTQDVEGTARVGCYRNPMRR
jgi:hypothetical protein